MPQMTNSYLLLTNKVVSCKNNLQVCEITKGSALYLLFVCVRAFLSGDELQKTISLMDDKKRSVSKKYKRILVPIEMT